jgi:hypothetical protein
MVISLVVWEQKGVISKNMGSPYVYFWYTVALYSCPAPAWGKSRRRLDPSVAMHKLSKSLSVTSKF